MTVICTCDFTEAQQRLADHWVETFSEFRLCNHDDVPARRLVPATEPDEVW